MKKSKLLAGLLSLAMFSSTMPGIMLTASAQTLPDDSYLYYEGFEEADNYLAGYNAKDYTASTYGEFDSEGNQLAMNRQNMYTSELVTENGNTFMRYTRNRDLSTPWRVYAGNTYKETTATTSTQTEGTAEESTTEKWTSIAETKAVKTVTTITNGTMTKENEDGTTEEVAAYTTTVDTITYTYTDTSSYTIWDSAQYGTNANAHGKGAFPIESDSSYEVGFKVDPHNFNDYMNGAFGIGIRGPYGRCNQTLGGIQVNAGYTTNSNTGMRVKSSTIDGFVEVKVVLNVGTIKKDKGLGTNYDATADVYITYKTVDGETVELSKTGIAITTSDNDGYYLDRFVGLTGASVWTNSNALAASEDYIDVDDVYIKKSVEYTLTFDAGDGSFAEGTTGLDSETGLVTIVNKGSQVASDKLPTPEMDSSAFAYWCIDEDLTTKFDPSDISVIDTDGDGQITLYAKYDTLYTVTFDVNGGDELESNTYSTAAGKMEEEDIPTPTNGALKFVGWFLDDGTAWDGTITSNFTVTAKWDGSLFSEDFQGETYKSGFAPVNAGYTATVETDAETGNKYLKYTHTASVEGSGNVFNYAEYGNANVWGEGAYPIKSNTVYEAGFKFNYGNWTGYAASGIKLQIRGPWGRDVTNFGLPGTDWNNGGNLYSDKFGLPNISKIDGFVEYRAILTVGDIDTIVTDADGNKVVAYNATMDEYVTYTNTDGEVVEKSILGTAVKTQDTDGYRLDRFAGISMGENSCTTDGWVAIDDIYFNVMIPTGSVTFVTGDENVTIDPMLAYNGKITEVPNIDNEAFSGWYLDEEGTTAFTNENINSDITVYAKYATIYTVTFDVNGGDELESNTYSTAKGFMAEELIPTPTHGAYTFMGWYTEDGSAWDGTITADITVYAEWDDSIYREDFEDDDYLAGYNAKDYSETTYKTVDDEGNEITKTRLNMYTSELVTENGNTFMRYTRNRDLSTAWSVYAGTNATSSSTTETTVTEGTAEEGTTTELVSFSPTQRVVKQTTITNGTTTNEAGEAVAAYTTTVVTTTYNYGQINSYTIYDSAQYGTNVSGTGGVFIIDSNTSYEAGFKIAPHSFNDYMNGSIGIGIRGAYGRCAASLGAVSVNGGYTTNSDTGMRVKSSTIDGFVDVKVVLNVGTIKKDRGLGTNYDATADVYITYKTVDGETVELSKTGITITTSDNDGYYLDRFVGLSGASVWTNSNALSSEDYFDIDDIYIKAMKSYNITFDAVDGSFTEGTTGLDSETGNVVIDNGGSTISSSILPAPEMDGYAFAYWCTDPELTQKFDPSDLSVLDEDGDGKITLYAKYDVIYTVTFDPNGGTVDTESYSTASGEMAEELIPTPTNGAKKFVGWFLEDGSAWDGTITSNFTVYAEWDSVIYNEDFNDGVYADEYNAAGGRYTSELVTDENGNSYMKYTRDSSVAFEGSSYQIFKYDERGTANTAGAGTYPIVSNAEYIAGFKIDFGDYTGYMPATPSLNIVGAFGRCSLPIGAMLLNGGNLSNSELGISEKIENIDGFVEVIAVIRTGDITTKVYDDDENIVAQQNASYDLFVQYTKTDGTVVTKKLFDKAITTMDSDGYYLDRFTGIGASEWTSETTNNGSFYLDDVYFEIKAPAKTVTYNSNGGSDVEMGYADPIGDVTLPADPTKSGYSFAGWFRDEAMTIPFDGTNISEDITVYARWQVAPNVTGTSADGVKFVDVQPEIAVKFDSELDSASVTKSSIKVLRDGEAFDKAAYELSCSIDPTTRNSIVTIKFNSKLDYGTEYEVVVTTDVANAAGNMAEEYSTTFTTQFMKLTSGGWDVVDADTGAEITSVAGISGKTIKIKYNISLSAN